MLRERLRALFKNYDPAVRRVIDEVGEMEQQLISMKSPVGFMTRSMKSSLVLQKKNLHNWKRLRSNINEV